MPSAIHRRNCTNEIIHLILSRRSTRDAFLDQTVPEEVIREIVRCGLAAPSSKNARPWKLHIVTDRALLQELARAVARADGANIYVPVDPLTGLGRSEWNSTVSESAATLRAVPLGIFIENLGAFSHGMTTLASVPRDRLQDCLETYTLEVLGIGTAIMNMWLAASALGLKAAFLGDVCVARAVIAEKLGIQCDLIGVLAVGYSRSDPVRDRIETSLFDPARIAWHRAAP